MARYCPSGRHELTPENTLLDRNGYQRCRICRRQRDRDRAAARRDERRVYAQRYRAENPHLVALANMRARARRSAEDVEYGAEQQRLAGAALREMFPPGPKHGRSWSPEEDAIVLRDDISRKEMCALLRRMRSPRTYKAVDGRRRKLIHGLIKGQARKDGEHNNAAKLRESEVAEIRAATGVSQSRLAAVYGVSQAMISLIRRGKNWTHVES